MADSSDQRWLARSYAHVVLPAPFLTDEWLSIMDSAVTGKGSWRIAEPVETSGPVLLRRWQRKRGGGLLLVVVGWYPAVVTVGAVKLATPSVRRATRRVVAAVVAKGARRVGDVELPAVLEAAGPRWQSVVDAWLHREQGQRWMRQRQCGRCGAWSAFAARHCTQCVTGFGSAEDADRDERARQATMVAARGSDELAGLARGQGLFADWPAGVRL